LDVDAIDRDTADFYVAVGDIFNEASSIEVALDAGAVLGELAFKPLERSIEYLQECS
jgi:hypothetical protein